MARIEKEIDEFRSDVTDMTIKLLRDCKERDGYETSFVLGILMAGALEATVGDILKEIGAKDDMDKVKKEIKEVDISEAFAIIQMISKTNEYSATQCFETINKIKEMYGKEIQSDD